MRGRREVQAFSLSFLDAIACGFGAILLLLVIAKVTEPLVIERTTEDLRTRLEELRDRLELLRDELVELEEETESRNRLVASQRARLDSLTATRSDLRARYRSATKDNSVTRILEERLTLAKEDLQREMDRVTEYDFEPSDTIAGIPADSQYVIFIIDTSGSMFQYAWPLVQRKVSETLMVYPEVRGIQVMNDMGQYMFSRYRGEWLPDSRARRRAIVERLKTWRPYSNSSPVEGITRAISTFYSPEKKISLYVFGDEYSGEAVQPVLDAVARVNRAGVDGERLVRIHAVGFPVLLEQPPSVHRNGIMFARLMRLLCAQNGGTFVGLNSSRL